MLPMRWLVPLLLVACGSSPRATPEPKPIAAPEARAEPGDDTPITGAWQDLGMVGDEHHAPRRLRAWVPDHDPHASLPSLVVLDGDGAEAFFALPTTIAALAGQRRIRPFVILALSSTAARGEELSRADARFADFLAASVVPYARSRLPLSSAREDTAILGYSYGGLQAAAAAVRYPEVFGRAVVQSPSLWVEGRALTSLLRRGSGALPVRMWIDVGTAEPDREELIPYMVRDARAFRDAAIARGMVWGRELGYLEAVGEHHDMRAGGRRMREALLFALGDDDLTEAAPTLLSILRHARVGDRTTFSIELGYDGGARLTLPRQLAEVFANGAPLRGEVASVGRRLTVRSHGLEARCE